MPLTKEQIRDRAAQDLGILELGQSLDSTDNARVLRAYTEVFEELKTKGLTTWPFSGEVPDELVPYVVAMICHNCLSTYNVSNDRYLRMENAFNVAEPNLRRLINLNATLQDEPTDY